MGYNEEANLLGPGDANEIANRYKRFIKTVQPFDEVMQYLEDDSAIYVERYIKVA